MSSVDLEAGRFCSVTSVFLSQHTLCRPLLNGYTELYFVIIDSNIIAE